MDEMFSGVDFSYVPSGILYDHGFPFIDLTLFQGDLSLDNKSSMMAFGLAYASITSMEINDTNNLSDPTNYRSIFDCQGRFFV